MLYQGLLLETWSEGKKSISITDNRIPPSNLETSSQDLKTSKLGSPPLTLRPQVKCRSLEKDIYSSVRRKNSMGYFLMQQLTHNLKLESCVLAISQHKSWCMNYTSECQWVINLICHSVSYLVAVQWLYGCLYLVVQFWKSCFQICFSVSRWT